VVPGHANVSRLSAAIRHRLVTEWEVAEAPLVRYAPSTVEKFTQEVYWRSYWKGWLSLRPQVWDEYREGIEGVEGAQSIRQGEGPVAAMNDFARELVETGYLHNHARMWFAAYWVHVERLPWQLGAKFFQDHLLDFDPASNTLSWRWVAGWQTPGKTYLPRRSNIEKYLHPDLLNHEGLERLENPSALMPNDPVRPPVTCGDLPEEAMPEDGRVLWLHEEDLHPESSPLGAYRPSRIVLTGDPEGRSDLQSQWLERALSDTEARARKHYQVELERAKSLPSWLARNDGTKVVGLRPEVGPLRDSLGDLGVGNPAVSLVGRPEDRFLRGFAKGGFFGFWKKLQSRLKAGDFPLGRSDR
jgi:deoxyribodipyrimidine photo-lyase